MQALLDVILPVFLLIGLGYTSVWRGWFSEDWIEGIMRFTQTFAVPCMLFRGVSQLDLGAQLSLSMLFSFYAGVLICFLVGLFGARVFFGRPWPDCVAIGFIAMFSNTVLLGLPITERAWGPEALAGNYSIIAFHPAFGYMVGITAMELVKSGPSSGILRGLARVLTGMLKTPLVVAVLLGLAFNLTGITLPGSLTDAADMLARAALPGALFGLGGTLYFYRPEGDMRVILYVVAISLLLHPTITFALGSALDVSQDGFRSAVLTAAMAPGANAYLFAAQYGVAKRVAASAVLIATALTLVTAWLWLMVIP